jgi:hypothetical protein
MAAIAYPDAPDPPANVGNGWIRNIKEFSGKTGDWLTYIEGFQSQMVLLSIW